VFTGRASINSSKRPTITGLVAASIPEELKIRSNDPCGWASPGKVLGTRRGKSYAQQLLVAGRRNRRNNDELSFTVKPRGRTESLSNASKPIFEEAAKKDRKGLFRGRFRNPGDSLPDGRENGTSFLLGDLSGRFHGNQSVTNDLP